MSFLHAPPQHIAQMLATQQSPHPTTMSLLQRAAATAAYATLVASLAAVVALFPSLSLVSVSMTLGAAPFVPAVYLAVASSVCIGACALNHFPVKENGHMAEARTGGTGSWPLSFFTGLSKGAKLCCTGW